jgi:hypothetical protein
MSIANIFGAVVLCGVVSVPVFASEVRSASLSDLYKDVQSLGDMNSGSCAMSAVASENGLVLTVKSDAGKVVSLQISRDAEILLKSEVSDGSESRYKISGVGMVTITHADDAFEKIAITDGRDISECEVDF